MSTPAGSAADDGPSAAGSAVPSAGPAVGAAGGGAGVGVPPGAAGSGPVGAAGEDWPAVGAAGDGRGVEVPPGAAESEPVGAAGGGGGVAGPAGGAAPSGSGRWRAPLTWRVLLLLARVLIVPVCRLRVTGDVPPALRAGPAVLAANHIGPFDPVAITAACRVRRLAPRLMATGGLFRAPVVGSVMRAAGHLRVNRRQADVADVLHDVTDALRAGSLVLGYPEGRITLDPGMWPERGKTGLARVALRSGVAVVPVAQWGAHEVLAWGGFGAMLGTLLRSLWRRPVVRVHFGAPLDLSDLVDGAPGAAQRATDRIIDAITAELAPLRAGEPRLPRFIDPARPLSTGRSHHRPTV